MTNPKLGISTGKWCVCHQNMSKLPFITVTSDVRWALRGVPYAVRLMHVIYIYSQSNIHSCITKFQVNMSFQHVCMPCAISSNQRFFRIYMVNNVRLSRWINGFYPWYCTYIPGWMHIQGKIQNNDYGHHGGRRILSQAHWGLLLFSNAAIPLCQLLWLPRSDSSVND